MEMSSVPRGSISLAPGLATGGRGKSGAGMLPPFHACVGTTWLLLWNAGCWIRRIFPGSDSADFFVCTVCICEHICTDHCERIKFLPRQGGSRSSGWP